MITKADVLTLLVDIENTKNLSVNNYIEKLLTSEGIPNEILKFIIDNKDLEIVNFYEMLRIKHNKNKSPLYLNIIRGEEAKQDIITTLSCLLLQIILYSNKLESKTEFLRQARVEEITRVLNEYFNDQDLEGCIKLINLIKADLMVLEYLTGRRKLEN
jgi:hypothetical protein